MKTSVPKLERWLAAALALVRTAICVYRAQTQSLTHDEAFAFNTFLSGSWHDLYFRYEPNNHLLFSILAKVSTILFGNSEFAIRLPVVISGFLLMLGVWRVLKFVESRPIRWLAFVALALDPFLFDFSVAARGYGLVVASLAWALVAAMNKRYIAAGFLLGLAVSANFSSAFPAIALMCVVFLVWEGSVTRRIARVAGMALAAAIPILITCGGVLSILPGYKFTAGFELLKDSLTNLAWVSIHDSTRDGLFGTYHAAEIWGWYVLPAVATFTAIACLFAWRRGVREALIPSMTLVVGCLGLIAAHYVAKIYYPIDRTGLWLMLLFGVGWAAALDNTPSRLLRGANFLVALALTFQFASQFHTDMFGIWWYDRSTKEVAHRIEAEIRSRPAASVSLGLSWEHMPALEYYRVRDRVAALQPVTRQTPTELSGHDYYVLNQNYETFPVQQGRTVLFSDAIAGVSLMK